MNMARPVTALSCAIDAYRAAPSNHWGPGTGRLTPGAEAMLDRLRGSKEATEAFASWGLSDGKTPFFIADCLEAHRLLNGGHKKKVAARRASAAPDKARKHLAEVAAFFRKSGYRMHVDPKAVRNRTELCLGPDPDVLSEAIALLASQIDSTEDINKSARPTVSRKGDKPSALSSALGLLKQSIHRASGRPDLKTVEAIAEVVLDLRGSVADLATAIKNARTPSDWVRQWGK